MKKFKVSTFIVGLLFLSTSTVFASWWNPFTWSFFTKRQNQKVENVVSVKDSKVEEVVKEGGDNLDKNKKENATSSPADIEKIGFSTTTSIVTGQYKISSSDCTLKNQLPLLKIVVDVSGSTSTEIIIPDVVSAIKKSGIEEYFDIVNIFAQPKNSNVIILSGSRCHTEGGQYPLVSYNTKTLVFTKLKISEDHSFWNAWRLSPDQRKIVEATWSEDKQPQLIILDLLYDTKTVLKELPVGKNFSSICELGCESNLKWVNNSTVEYGVYKNPIHSSKNVEVFKNPENIYNIDIFSEPNTLRYQVSKTEYAFLYSEDISCNSQLGGDFSIETGDGDIYKADCKGVLQHTYQNKGYYIAKYLKDGKVIASIGVHVNDGNVSPIFTSSLSARPNIAPHEGKSVINWRILYIDNLDDLKKPFCVLKAQLPRTYLNYDKTKEEERINLLLSGNTDDNDPNGLRPITEALNETVKFDQEKKYKIIEGVKTINNIGQGYRGNVSVQFLLICNSKDNTVNETKKTTVVTTTEE